jgi:heterotetrameric sarcosine oxidase alpha subunit
VSARRLETGGVVDRSDTRHFTWDGKRMTGLAGDSLASALMANGERILGRGFKYHRPRSVMSAGVEEGGAIVTVGTGARRTPNVKATALELVDGLEAFGQNAWPSVRFDVGRVNDLLGRFFGAGFYYKTFMGVTGSGTWEWMQFEKLIRQAAGMGEASREPDPDWCEIVHGFCDVLVVGSGPAGLAAAEAAAEAGCDVLLAEQDFALGGDLLGAAGPVGEEDAAGWRAARLSALRGSDRVRLLPRTTVFGLYDGCVAGLVERVTEGEANPSPDQPRERVHILRAKRIVIAAGALERPIAFGNNDRPGVMTAAAARTYVARYGVLPGETVAMATTNDGAYADAAALAEAGARVTLLDARAETPEALAGAAAKAGVEVLPGMVPVKVEGRHEARRLWIGAHEGGGKATPLREIDAEIVAVSGGWSPVVHLLSHRKVRPVWSEHLACFLPGETHEPIHVAGAAAGVWASETCALSGRAAGLAAAKALGVWGGSVPNAPASNGWARPIEPVYEVKAERWKLKSFVDPQHDVTAGDIRLSQQEGFVSVEHAKRYTTLGMATDQGKVGNVVGLALMAEATGRSIPEVGVTTFRPPYTPVSIGALAGTERDNHWRPTRYTPMHDDGEAAGARFTEAGAWLRTWYFPREGESLAAASKREAAMVREAVGFVDVSSLGKIMVQGPDAAEFLNRIYVNGFAKLPVGKARYGVMLREDGIVFDDGTTWRLSETDFFMTTTTANAGPVMALLERLLQTRWTDLRVHVTSVSDGWGGVAVAGPKARDALRGIVPDIDWSDQAYPFMAVREGHMQTETGPIPVRTARLSFSGEQAWEVFTPSDYGAALHAAVAKAVAAQGGAPYGLEALDVLRVEKGHVTGRELDGRVTIDDLGLGKMASKKKDYLGKALAQRPDLVREDRPTLVGLKPADPGKTFPAGAVLCAPGHVGGHGVGWVSSIADSPHLGWIGLGFAEGGLAAWEGKRLIAADPARGGGETEVVVVSNHFYDPDGGRMHG